MEPVALCSREIEKLDNRIDAELFCRQSMAHLDLNLFDFCLEKIVAVHLDLIRFFRDHKRLYLEMLDFQTQLTHMAEGCTSIPLWLAWLV